MRRRIQETGKEVRGWLKTHLDVDEYAEEFTALGFIFVIAGLSFLITTTFSAIVGASMSIGGFIIFLFALIPLAGIEF